MKTIRAVLAAMLISASSALSPVHATSFSTDQSDLWWVPTESGWGMQLVQRGSVIFATVFVYDNTRGPYWFYAVLNNVSGTSVWTGQLSANMGPYYGAVPFDPAAVTASVIGNLTWTATSVNNGRLDYTALGVTVSKNMTRQTLVLDNFTGVYGGGIHQIATACSNPLNNGTTDVFTGFEIVHAGTAINITSQSGALVCTFTGTYAQAGQMGNSVGTYSCTNGDAGTFALFESQVSVSGFSSHFSTSSTVLGCQTTGNMAGVRSQ
jgi:hypothetical protein